jgi:hypothetical protein
MLFVDVPGGTEDAVGPKREDLVAAASGEADALFDQTGTQAQPAGFGLDQKEPELGGLLASSYEEDASNSFAPYLGDPATLFARVKAIDEVSYDPRDQRFEAFVPAVLLGIQHAVSVDHPSHVSGLLGAQQEQLGVLQVLLKKPSMVRMA